LAAKVYKLTEQIPKKQPDVTEEVLEERFYKRTKWSSYKELLVKWKDNDLDEAN
jgi:hypothetical protein